MSEGIYKMLFKYVRNTHHAEGRFDPKVDEGKYGFGFGSKPINQFRSLHLPTFFKT
jgi:hypothetical protein